MSLTFGEQLKIVLKQRNMSVKELASEIEKFTGKPMSRQNLNQKLGRNNFQEKDMRMIAEILDLTFTLDILGGEVEKLPVEKVIEGNMTVAEVLNLKDDEAKKASTDDAEQGATEQVITEETAVVEEKVSIEENVTVQVGTTVEECVMDSAQSAAEEITTGFAEAIEDKTNRVMQDVDSVNFMKKKGSFEEPPINMQNYRSKKDLFIDLDVQEEVNEEVPQKTSEELIAELLREMEEIERDKATQIQEAKERQEKWESRRKENNIVSRIGKWFKSAIKNRNAEEKIEQQPDEEYLNEAFLLEDHSLEDRSSELVVEDAEVENRISEQTEETVENNVLEQAEERVENDVLEQAEETVENDILEQVEEELPENNDTEQEEEKAQELDLNTEIENLKEMIPAEELVSNEDNEIVFAPAKEEILGEINPYTGVEYETNSVRNHKERIGYVQVYSREIHGWKDMTEWAFLGYQEKKRVEQGENYVPPIYLD